MRAKIAGTMGLWGNKALAVGAALCLAAMQPAAAGAFGGQCAPRAAGCALAARSGAVLRMRGGEGGEGDNVSNLAAYMLCKMGGNEAPTTEDVT